MQLPIFRTDFKKEIDMSYEISYCTEQESTIARDSQRNNSVSRNRKIKKVVNLSSAHLKFCGTQRSSFISNFKYLARASRKHSKRYATIKIIRAVSPQEHPRE